MISIIVGTNRDDSKSGIIGQYYYDQLKQEDNEVSFLNMNSLTLPLLNSNVYEAVSQTKEVKDIQDQYFIGADRWIFILPEYNGGLPGVFKYLLDAMSIREYEATFKNKKVALVGVSAGKAGNLRGLDYATNLLGYVKCNVYGNKLPISQINSLLSEDKLVDADTQEAITNHIKGFLEQ